MCALPKNGSRWCSHSEYSSMSRTITMLSCRSSNSASPITPRAVSPYPRVSQAIDLATRSGVLSRPARAPSSPSSSSCRRTSCSYSGWAITASLAAATAYAPSPPCAPRAASATFVLDIVVLRLPESQPGEPARRHARREHVPARDYNVLGRRIDPVHEVDVHVHVLVVEAVDHLALHDLLQHTEVDDVARALVHRAGDAHLERVVVSVPVRVVALPEQPGVLLVRERRVVDAVRRVEAQAARGGHVGHGRRWTGSGGAAAARPAAPVRAPAQRRRARPAFHARPPSRFAGAPRPLKLRCARAKEEAPPGAGLPMCGTKRGF